MYPFSRLEKHKCNKEGIIDFKEYEYKFDPSESDLNIEAMSNEESYSVFNVSTKVELQLLKNFNLPCIKREVENQLSSLFYQKIPNNLRFQFVEYLDFKYPDTIFSIEHKTKDIIIFLFR